MACIVFWRGRDAAVDPDSTRATVPARKALDLSGCRSANHPPFGERGFWATIGCSMSERQATICSPCATASVSARVPRIQLAGFGGRHTLDRVMGDAAKQHPDWWPPLPSGSFDALHVQFRSLPGYC